jgi:hypothetical protein
MRKFVSCILRLNSIGEKGKVVDLQLIKPYSYASISWFRFKGFVSLLIKLTETSQALATPQDAGHFIIRIGFLQV